MNFVKYVLLALALMFGGQALHAQIGPWPCGGNTAFSTYRPEVSYLTGQVVISYGVSYQSLVNNNKGNLPCTSPSDWTNIIGTGTGTGTQLPFPGIVYGTSPNGGTVATSAQIAAALNVSPSTQLSTALLPQATTSALGTVEPDGTTITINSSTGAISASGVTTSAPLTGTTAIACPTCGVTTGTLGQFATGGTISPKVINGVSYSALYTTQSDIGARINLCITDAETRANGNTTGICSSEGEAGLAAGVTTHTPIVVGDTSGDGVDWELPAQCIFNFFGGSFTGSVASTGITQYSNTKIHSPGGVDQCKFVNDTGISGNMYALYLAQSSTSNTAGTYAKIDGISFQNGTFSVPVTTASTHDMIVQFMTDNSKFENFNIVDFGAGQIPIQIGGNAGSTSSVGSPCCATMFENINVNGEYDTGTILQITGNSTNGSAALVSFTNASLDHPAPGSAVISCTDTLHQVHVAFDHLYTEIEWNSSGQVAPIYIDGTASTANACAEINVHDEEIKNEGSYSAPVGNPIWQINGTYAGGLQVVGTTIPFNFTKPVTVVQNNVSTFCASAPCNLTTDSNGLQPQYVTGISNFDQINFLNTPLLLGSAWLGTGSAPGPLQCDNTTTTCAGGVITAAVTASSAWNGITSGTNTQTGAFSTAGPWTFSSAGAASTPGVEITGAPYAGGTGTTTFPQFYLNFGTAPTTWPTTGTAFGINLPSATVNAIDVHNNGGVSLFKVGANGAVSTNSSLTAGGQLLATSTTPLPITTTNTAAATSSACSAAGAHNWTGTYWTGSASASDTISLTPSCTPGTNGAETITLSNSGSSGGLNFVVSGGLTTGGGITLPSSSTAIGLSTGNAQTAYNTTGLGLSTNTAGNVAVTINNSAATPTADLLDIQANTIKVASVGPTGIGNFPAVSAPSAGSETVASSATPTFSVSFGTSYNVLTANVTSFTLANGLVDGQHKTLCWNQGAGGFTVTPPSNVHGFATVGTTASLYSCQSFVYNSANTIWLATDPGVINE